MSTAPNEELSDKTLEEMLPDDEEFCAELRQMVNASLKSRYPARRQMFTDRLHDMLPTARVKLINEEGYEVSYISFYRDRPYRLVSRLKEGTRFAEPRPNAEEVALWRQCGYLNAE